MNETVSQALPIEQEQHDPVQEAVPETVTAAEEDPTADQTADEPAQEEQPTAQEESDAEEDHAAPDPQEQLATMTRQVADAELRAAAALAGVPAGKLTYVVRMCDAAALCQQGVDMGKLAADQVAAVLRDVPELASVPRSLPGSLGDHKNTGTPGKSAEDLAREAFAARL